MMSGERLNGMSGTVSGAREMDWELAVSMTASDSGGGGGAVDVRWVCRRLVGRVNGEEGLPEAVCRLGLGLVWQCTPVVQDLAHSKFTLKPES